MISLRLIGKISEYYSDVKKTEGRTPALKQIAVVNAILSYILWGTSFSEYFGYRFWERTLPEKKTYMTRRHMFKFFDRYNPPEYRNRIGDKSVAPNYYGQFLHREQIDREAGFDNFREYCNKHQKIFVKKKIGWGGDGDFPKSLYKPRTLPR